MEFAVIWGLVKTFWKPIAGILAVLAVFGSLKYWGHTKYEEGLAVGEAKYEECNKNFGIQKSLWDKQVEQQKRELVAFEKDKQSIIDSAASKYNQLSRKVATNKQETTNEIKATIQPTDRAIVPYGFVSVYNHAVEGSRIAQGISSQANVPDYSTGVESKVVTFDATYFTTVIKSNVDEYNSLAARCDKLIDVVTDLEKQYGRNIEGSENKVESVRGNLPDGAAGVVK
jgi:hypothetical protein